MLIDNRRPVYMRQRNYYILFLTSVIRIQVQWNLMTVTRYVGHAGVNMTSPLLIYTLPFRYISMAEAWKQNMSDHGWSSRCISFNAPVMSGRRRLQHHPFDSNVKQGAVSSLFSLTNKPSWSWNKGLSDQLEIRIWGLFHPKVKQMVAWRNLNRVTVNRYIVSHLSLS